MPVVLVSTATDVGRVRHNNEDYVKAERITRDDRHFRIWAVADGVGGGPQGERASLTAVETVVDYLANEPWSDPSVALSAAFSLANSNVFEITGVGATASTLVVALVSETDRMVAIANVGDSRAYLVTDSVAWQITHDHSIVAARVAAGQLTAAEARTAPDRNVLTRGIGSEREVQVDVFGPRQLQPNQRLVLCSDGVHGMIEDSVIGQLGGGLAIAECAGALVAAAVEAGGRDNATALVAGFELGARSVQASAPASAAAPKGMRRLPRRAILVAIGVVVAILLAVVLLNLMSSSPAKFVIPPGPSSGATSTLSGGPPTRHSNLPSQSLIIR